MPYARSRGVLLIRGPEPELKIVLLGVAQPDLAIGAPEDGSGSSSSGALGALYVVLLTRLGDVKASYKVRGCPCALLPRVDVSVSGVVSVFCVAVFVAFAASHPSLILKVSPGSSGVLASSLGSSSFFGGAIASIGDLDGDNITEIAVGARKGGVGGAGAVIVVFPTSSFAVKSSSVFPTRDSPVEGVADGCAFG